MMFGGRNADRRTDRRSVDTGTGPGTGQHPEYGPVANFSTDRTGEGAGLEPIKAWKIAHFHDHPILPFWGIGVPIQYGTDSTAECSNHGRHHAPSADCSCGFYANADTIPREAPYTPRQVLLEVELFGHVIVHKHGYRAERQRVLAIYARKSSFVQAIPCLAQVSREMMTTSEPRVFGSTFTFQTTAAFEPMTPHTFQHVPTVSDCGHTATWQAHDQTPLCTFHAIRWPRKFTPLAVEDPETPDLGGVEWHWL